jgi:hypothetical protein
MTGTDQDEDGSVGAAVGAVIGAAVGAVAGVAVVGVAGAAVAQVVPGLANVPGVGEAVQHVAEVGMTLGAAAGAAAGAAVERFLDIHDMTEDERIDYDNSRCYPLEGYPGQIMP